MNKKMSCYPKWSPMHFPRLRALGDRILHQTQVKTYVEGGTVELEKRRLSEYEAIVKGILINKLSPIEKDLASKTQELVALEATTRTLVSPGDTSEKQSTRAVRAHKAQASASKAIEEKSSTLRKEILVLYRDANAEISTAQALLDAAVCATNKSLATWGKATRFAVLQEELPKISSAAKLDYLLDEEIFEAARKKLGLTKPVDLEGAHKYAV